MTALNDRQQAIRAKLARGEALNPAEELEWMDANMVGIDGPGRSQELRDGETLEPRDDEEDEEDTEHHDVGLRRGALNIIMIERGEMFGTAVPIHKDMNQTMTELQKIVVEVYAARRAQDKL